LAGNIMGTERTILAGIKRADFMVMENKRSQMDVESKVYSTKAI